MTGLRLVSTVLFCATTAVISAQTASITDTTQLIIDVCTSDAKVHKSFDDWARDIEPDMFKLDFGRKKVDIRPLLQKIYVAGYKEGCFDAHRYMVGVLK